MLPKVNAREPSRDPRRFTDYTHPPFGLAVSSNEKQMNPEVDHRRSCASISFLALLRRSGGSSNSQSKNHSSCAVTVHERTPTSETPTTLPTTVCARARAAPTERIPFDPNQHPRSPLKPAGAREQSHPGSRGATQPLRSLEHLSRHTCDADLGHSSHLLCGLGPLRVCRLGIDQRELGLVRVHLAAAVACHGVDDAAGIAVHLQAHGDGLVVDGD